MGAGSSINIERIQIQNNKLITTNMSVIPIQLGEVSSNLYSVQRNEQEIPMGNITQDEFALLPFRLRN